MNHAIAPGITPAPRGLEREEPEIGQEDDIPTDDRGSARSNEDPEKGGVESPQSEHPTQ